MRAGPDAFAPLMQGVLVTHSQFTGNNPGETTVNVPPLEQTEE